MVLYRLVLATYMIVSIDTTRNVGFPESLLIQLCITQWFLIDAASIGSWIDPASIGKIILWHKRRVKGSWKLNFSGGEIVLLRKTRKY